MGKEVEEMPRWVGGEGGIRTLDGLLAHTPLAGERLRPLGHLSLRIGIQPLFDFRLTVRQFIAGNRFGS